MPEKKNRAVRKLTPEPFFFSHVLFYLTSTALIHLIHRLLWGRAPVWTLEVSERYRDLLMSWGLVRLGQDSGEDSHMRCGTREGGRGCRNGVNLLEDELKSLMFSSAWSLSGLHTNPAVIEQAVVQQGCVQILAFSLCRKYQPDVGLFASPMYRKMLYSRNNVYQSNLTVKKTNSSVCKIIQVTCDLQFTV